MWREEVALLVGGKDLSQAHHVVLVTQDKPEANNATKRAERHAPDEAGCVERRNDRVSTTAQSCRCDDYIISTQVAQMEIVGVDR